MPGRLNSFQRTMLHWNDLHPYNAIFVVRIPSALNQERLIQAINRVLAGSGLTNLTLDRQRGTFCYHGGPSAFEIKTVAGEGVRDLQLDVEIEAQLNIPFDAAARFLPFRFFVLPEAEGFSLGIVYFHPIADAEALALLARDLMAAYQNLEAPLSSPLNPHPVYPHSLLAHPKMLLKKLLTLPAYVGELRRSSRRNCGDANDHSNRFTRFTLHADELGALSRTAKTWNITLNDLMMAMLLKCFGRLPSDRWNHPRRHKISIGGIANIRKDLGLAGQQIFGPFLGTFGVTHGLPEGVALQEVAQDICRQTTAIKRDRLYLGSPLELGFGRWIFNHSSPKRQKSFYQKNYPLWGGVTNVNLNAIWKASPAKKIPDAFSTASTGPVIPLVFAVTTAGETVHLAITWRPAFFSGTDIEQVKKDFAGLVAGLWG